MHSTIYLTDDDIRTAITQLLAERFRAVIDPTQIELEVSRQGSTIWHLGKIRAVVNIDFF
jgi:hypothetical protein